MHYVWDTEMNKTDPPQSGGTKGGGVFDIGGWEKCGGQAAATVHTLLRGIGRWSQGSESSTDSSVQARVGETDRGTGSGNGKYEMTWEAFLEVLGK